MLFYTGHHVGLALAAVSAARPIHGPFSGSWQAFSNWGFLGWAFHQQPKLANYASRYCIKSLSCPWFPLLEKRCAVHVFESLPIPTCGWPKLWRATKRIGLPILKHAIMLWPHRRSLGELWIAFLPNQFYLASPRRHLLGLVKQSFTILDVTWTNSSMIP